jgi:hypothetical protein
MLKKLLILIFLLGVAQAQLFDSIGGTLKDTNLGGSLGSTPASPTPTDTSFLNYTPDPAVSQQVKLPLSKLPKWKLPFVKT